MRKQVGWVNQRTGHFCCLGIKTGPHGKRFKDYSVPAFIDDEPEPPTLLQAQVWNRILVNQQLTMMAVRDSGHLDVTARGHLAEAIGQTVEIIGNIRNP